MTSQYLVAVDIGATKISASLSDKRGFLVKVRQPVALEGEPADVAKQVFFLIEHCCKKAGVGLDDVDTVGVSSAGPFVKDDKGRISLVSPNMCGDLAREGGIVPNDWDCIPLEAVLGERFGTVRIGNDAVTGRFRDCPRRR